MSELTLKNIGDVCTVIAGQSPEGKFYNSNGNGMPFYQGKKEFNEKYIGEPTTWTTKITKESLEGDILMSVRAPVGPVNFSTQKICIGRGLAAIRPSENISRDYLFYFLLMHESQIVGNTGAVFNSINKAQIEKIQLPVPSLTEQNQIVIILNEAFEAIDKAKANIEKNIENAEELFHSKLNELFTQNEDGWEEKKLKDISIQFGRGKSKHRPRNDSRLYGGEYPFIQTGDVRNAMKYIHEYTQTYNEIGLKQSKLWPKDTICITIAANIAETAILTFDACFPDSMIGLVVDTKKADINFTFYALQYLKSALQLMGKGSAQDNINLGTFEVQKFPFPSLKNQKQAAMELDIILEKTKRLSNQYAKKLAVIEELRKSILQKAFSGTLINNIIEA